MKKLLLLPVLAFALAACRQQTFPAQNKLTITLSGPGYAPIKILDSTGQIDTDQDIVSGYIRTLKAGIYTVQPGNYPGYQTPPNQVADLLKGDVTVNLVYYPYVEPPIPANVQWRR